MRLFSQVMIDLIDKMPESVVWRFARRYIAGSDLESALNVRKALYSQGMLNTMDILGEDVHASDQAEKSVSDYRQLIAGMHASGIPGNVSIKLTQIGLKIDPELTRQRAMQLARESAKHGFLFRLDMEDAVTTSFTIDLYRLIQREIPDTGMVIQAYLKRSEEDVRKLLSDVPANIRICKGIYKESPVIAYTDRNAVRSNFMKLLRMILDQGGYPAIATHDPVLIRQSMNEVEKRKLTPDRYEFQMLHGVGFKWRGPIMSRGHRLRIYIPYGESWRAYSFRRFRENPMLAYYVVKNLMSSSSAI